MNNIDKIKQEIQRLKSQLVRGASASQVVMETNCKDEAYDEVLSFINSLPEETQDVCSGCTNVKGCVTCVGGNMKELTVEDVLEQEKPDIPS